MIDRRDPTTDSTDLEPVSAPRLVGAPPDPRDVIEQLRDRLRGEQEKTLNAVDAVLGAQAAAAQAKAETREVYHRLHVRERELEQLKELLEQVDDDQGPAEPASGRQSLGGDMLPMAIDLAKDTVERFQPKQRLQSLPGLQALPRLRGTSRP